MSEVSQPGHKTCKLRPGASIVTTLTMSCGTGEIGILEGIKSHLDVSVIWTTGQCDQVIIKVVNEISQYSEKIFTMSLSLMKGHC